MGRILRYKIVCRNGVVDAILLNTGVEVQEVYFIEKRYQVGDLVKLSGGDLARVLTCPTGMLGRDW